MAFDECITLSARMVMFVRWGKDSFLVWVLKKFVLSSPEVGRTACHRMEGRFVAGVDKGRWCSSSALISSKPQGKEASVLRSLRKECEESSPQSNRVLSYTERATQGNPEDGVKLKTSDLNSCPPGPAPAKSARWRREGGLLWLTGQPQVYVYIYIYIYGKIIHIYGLRANLTETWNNRFFKWVCASAC